MTDYLYDKIQRVPLISDGDISEMRHIEPVLAVANTAMYQRIKDSAKLHPRNVSFLWDAEPVGDLFTFDTLDKAVILTQHESSVFFKPSLAEVYAWIRVYMPEAWENVRYFCMGNMKRIPHSSDCVCECTLMGGRMLKYGDSIMFPNGETGYQLVPAE